MKTITNLSVLVSILIAFLGASTLHAQGWTKAQKEVWKVTSDAWENWKNGDMDAAFANIHKKYFEWNRPDTAKVIPPEKLIGSAKKTLKNITLESYNIKPEHIRVYECVAVVDYHFEYYCTITRNGKSTKYHIKGENEEYYVKDGGKWMLISDISCAQKAN